MHGVDVGAEAAGEYISGFLLEKSLSVDNVFVWAVIFTYFAVLVMSETTDVVFAVDSVPAILGFVGVKMLLTFSAEERDVPV